MDFLRDYWPLLVCVVLIIVAIVVLIVFRDKPETDKPLTDGKTVTNDENKPQDENGESASLKEEKVEEKTEEKPAETETEKVEEKKVEEKTEEKPKKPRKTAKKTKTEEKADEKVEDKAEEKTEEKVEVKDDTVVVSEPKTKEAETKDATESEENMEDKKPSQKYMVTYDKDRKDWVVKKTGATRASKRCKTKKEAMEVAEKLAESQDLNISVKKKDGKFQKRENASK